MGEEQQLMALGWPFDEAFYVCKQLRKDGTLSRFMSEQWAKREPVPDPYEEVLRRASIQS